MTITRLQQLERRILDIDALETECRADMGLLKTQLLKLAQRKAELQRQKEQLMREPE